MILLITTDAEKTANDVIGWLTYLAQSFIRISERIPANLEMNLSSQSQSFYINGLSNSHFSAFWLRKGQFIFSIPLTDNSETLPRNTINYLSHEFEILSNFIIRQLEQKRHLGNYFNRNPNKLQHLQLAKESGLAIPKTLVASNKNSLIAFQKQAESLISKSIKDCFIATHESIYYYNHTERVTEDALIDMPDTFFPSLVQEELPKKYELRVVFVREKLYSMAIFSQLDKQTSVDWRNYNHQSPNRTVPYQLPNTVAKAIKQFIRASGLNMGAIDMVVTPDGQHVFLECNPNGQISMVSEHCNYSIEKDIATYLAYGIDPSPGT